ncbi:MAG TPA: 3-isopropylmalate dehydrogenase [Actinomycetales bacterium]|nr:3-isopropylmalate dehydrogenase [Actinomycetales bacterium]
MAASRRTGRRIAMTEAELYARRALQESMDLRDQGHSDD